jgi:hypothetical protein
VNVIPAEENLHYAWDDAVVAVLEKQLGTTDVEATAHKLEALYPATGELNIWKPGESEQIAWESHQLAEADVYGALGIPGEALLDAFLCPCYEHTLNDEPHVHGPRGASRRPPTHESRPSAGGTAHWDLIWLGTGALAE